MPTVTDQSETLLKETAGKLKVGERHSLDIFCGGEAPSICPKISLDDDHTTTWGMEALYEF